MATVSQNLRDVLRKKQEEKRRQIKTMGLDPNASRTSNIGKTVTSDIDRGWEQASKYISPGTLGRQSTVINPELQAMLEKRKKLQQGYQPNVRLGDVLNRREANLQGFTPEEMESYRQQYQTSAQQSQQGNLRQLMQQQASSGVRGPAALAQRAKMQQEFQKAQTERERDLFLKQIEAKRQALGEYQGAAKDIDAYESAKELGLIKGVEESAGGLEDRSRAIEQYNIAQGAKEREAQMGMAAALAQAAAAERAGLRGENISKEQSDAMIRLAEQYGQQTPESIRRTGLGNAKDQEALDLYYKKFGQFPKGY